MAPALVPWRLSGRRRRRGMPHDPQLRGRKGRDDQADDDVRPHRRRHAGKADHPGRHHGSDTEHEVHPLLPLGEGQERHEGDDADCGSAQPRGPSRRLLSCETQHPGCKEQGRSCDQVDDVERAFLPSSSLPVSWQPPSDEDHLCRKPLGKGSTAVPTSPARERKKRGGVPQGSPPPTGMSKGPGEGTSQPCRWRPRNRTAPEGTTDAPSNASSAASTSGCEGSQEAAPLLRHHSRSPIPKGPRHQSS